MQAEAFAFVDTGTAFVPSATPGAGAHNLDVAIVEQLVLRAFGIVLPTLVADRRGRAPIAFARQVAIYLTHVHLGFTLTAAAVRFRRDRTTAAHACRLVEDRREDPDVDRRIEAVETALDRWLAARRAGNPASFCEVLQ